MSHFGDVFLQPKHSCVPVRWELWAVTNTSVYFLNKTADSVVLDHKPTSQSLQGLSS